MKVTLYELAERYRTIAGMLESDTITREEIDQTLANLQDDIETKVDSIAKIVLESKATAEAIKNEEKRLASRRQAIENHVEWLKSYLLNAMVDVNLRKVKRDVVTISILDNPPSVEVIELESIPEQYIRIIPEQREADKKAIIEHFKETGEIISGVDIVLDKKHVSIR